MMRGRILSKHSIGNFIKKHYNIRLRDILGKSRETLLNDTEIVKCNLCESAERVVIAERDKYNLPVKTTMCKRCGLLYLCPRPTSASYRKFYESGGTKDSSYHRKLSADTVNDLLRGYFGPEFTPKHTEKDAELLLKDKDIRGVKDERTYGLYGRDILDYLSDIIRERSRVFEVGASEGELLLPWKNMYKCEVSGVEPKIQSVRIAWEKNNIRLQQGFSDNPDIPKGYYDLVLNIRSLDHMLDPFIELKRSWDWLKEGGHLFVDVKHFAERIRNSGLEKVIEIDHAYMFSMRTLSALIKKAGFEIVRTESVDVSKIYDPDNNTRELRQLRVVARKSTPPVKVDYPDPLAEASEIILSCQKHELSLSNKLNILKGKLDSLKGRHNITPKIRNIFK
jgi:2-polyprenyl-3-methyl-5-hydroxy-6-metoxy-1,4-benzoquinol methylase